MPLMLDDMRAEFARHLASQPGNRFSMDKALVHVLALAYAAGMDEAKVSRGETAPKCITVESVFDRDDIRGMA